MKPCEDCRYFNRKPPPHDEDVCLLNANNVTAVSPCQNSKGMAHAGPGIGVRVLRYNCTEHRCQARWDTVKEIDSVCPGCGAALVRIEEIPEGPGEPCPSCNREGRLQHKPKTVYGSYPICETCKGLGKV